MRITGLYFSGFGPFQGENMLHLDTDDERVLFLGISGSGKSTVLRGIAALWMELKRYSDHLPSAYEGIGSMAMVIQTDKREAIIACGKETLLKEAQKSHQGAWWLHAKRGGFDVSDENMPVFSNLCLLDGDREEAASYAPFFITDIDVLGFQKGQAAMEESKKEELMEIVNRLWVGKTLVATGEGLKARLDSGILHTISETSMGERRILGLCYLACTQLREGGVLLLDEPDVHVHPSQMVGLIAALEREVLKKNGQLMLISHHSELWNRYDLLGKVVVLGGTHERIG